MNRRNLTTNYTHRAGMTSENETPSHRTIATSANPSQIARCACAVGLLLLLALSGCCGDQPHSTRPPSSEWASLDPLLELMRERMQLMHDVARHKWNENKPISDPAREKQLLDGVEARSRELDLDPNWVRSFFAAQFEAAKLIQQADFDEWKSNNQSRFANPPDLAAIREQIDQVNGKLLVALHQAIPELKRHSAPALDQRFESLSGPILGKKERNVALEPLKHQTGL